MRDLGFEPAGTGEYYFLSYNSQDVDRIAPLFRLLSESGVPIWYDKGINYNTSQWSSEIANHIQNCKAVLFVQTKGLIQKKASYAKREYAVAKNLGKEIFVLAFDQVDIKSAPTENMFFVDELNNKQQIPITGNCSRDAEEVCQILKTEYKRHNGQADNHKSQHKILIPAVVFSCLAALMAFILIIKPVPTVSKLNETPTHTVESWTCKWCDSMNGYENSFCWKCKMERGTEPTTSPSPSPAPTPLSVNVDDHITFGHYPQTAEGTDSTPIEWRVLDVRDSRALVISEYGLDAQPYNDFSDTTWETCTLRRWLNNDFLNKAFSSTEQAAILTSQVLNDKNQGHYDTDGGTATLDNIFLLSCEEAFEYFNITEENDQNAEALAEPTAYAIKHGVWTSTHLTSKGNASGCWWLRSPGAYSSTASLVGESGYLGYADAVNEILAVRPAFWLSLSIAGGLDIKIGEVNPTSAASPSVTAGDHINFGSYPQTASGTDSTPIEWRVLDVQGGKALIISEYGLDAKPYNASPADITWEQCSLRKWLNDDFLNKAFSQEEQAYILETTVKNDKGQHCKDYSDTYKDYADTEDRIFLLSYAETNKYFKVTWMSEDNVDSRVEPTAFALNQGADADSEDMTSSGKTAGWWWLRSPGSSCLEAFDVHSSGCFDLYNVEVSSGTVRPALWLDLTALQN